MIFLLIAFILVPVVRVWLFVRRMRKQSNTMFEQMRQAAGGAGASETGTEAGYDPFAFFFSRMAQEQERQGAQEGDMTPTKRKKIDPEIGEYVDFQEIAVTTGETYGADGSLESFEAESQVIDVEWVDLPADEERKD